MMLRLTCSAAAAMALVVACDVTDPNVVDCEDDCPEVSGSGTGGSAGDAGAAGSGDAAGAAGGSHSGSGGRDSDSGQGNAGASATGGAGAGGSDGDAGAGDAGDAGEDAGGCGPCPAELPQCVDGTCVECARDEDCEDGVCAQNACVVCRNDSHCPDASASHCEDHACVPCSEDQQCEHITGKYVCDAGECVQCTGLDFGDCGRAQDGTRHACDALSRTCSNYTLGSAGLCDPCVSDAQCGTGQLCVMQYFDEVGDDPDQGEIDVGYRCFWREDATQPGAPDGSCANTPPFVDTQTASLSIEGTEAAVCALRVTTCAGYKDYSTKTCAGIDDDAACGDPRFASDGYCEMFATSAYRCTTPCLSVDDCKAGVTCNTAVTPNICTLQ